MIVQYFFNQMLLNLQIRKEVIMAKIYEETDDKYLDISV